MNRYVKKMGLMAGASVLALGVFATAPATAFDDVNWTWTATVDETVTKDVTITIDIEPTGMVMLEDLQIQIGDVTASSTVTGIYNNQPTGGSAGGEVEVDLGTIEFSTEYDPVEGGGAGDPDSFVDPQSVSSEGGDVEIEAEIVEGTVDEANTGAGNNGTVTGTIDLGTIVVEQAPGEALEFDALTELPEVISEATAIGNNTSIEADAAVQLHEAQVLVGGIDENGAGEDGEWEATDLIGNVTPATVSATSLVYDILNASVDSSATAVGNNLSVEIEATGDDRLLMADVVQLSVADVTATSTVYDVNLYNYTNLGALDRPIVSSVATAVGNNKSISVNTPDIDGGDDDGTDPQ